VNVRQCIGEAATIMIWGGCHHLCLNDAIKSGFCPHASGVRMYNMHVVWHNALVWLGVCSCWLLFDMPQVQCVTYLRANSVSMLAQLLVLVAGVLLNDLTYHLAAKRCELCNCRQ
jgi:hypothetical protein